MFGKGWTVFGERQWKVLWAILVGKNPNNNLLLQQNLKRAENKQSVNAMGTRHLPPEESNWQGLSKSLFRVWRSSSIIMLIVLSLACSAAVVLSWKHWVEGFPRTYLWGRAGCCLIWSKAGECQPAFPPIPCTSPCSSQQSPWSVCQVSDSLLKYRSWLHTAQPGGFTLGHSSSWAVAAWAGTGCFVGITSSVGRGQNHGRTGWGCHSQLWGLWGWLWHLGALPPFPSHSHHQWWCSSLPYGVLPLPSTPLMLSVLHNTFLALTVQERISRGLFESLRLSLTNVDPVLA